MPRVLIIALVLSLLGANQAEAAPVLLAFGVTLLGGAAAAIFQGAAIVWATVLGNAVVAGVLAGVQLALNKPPAPGATEITLNRIQALTNGLILYGERMMGGTIVARSTTTVGSASHARLHLVMPLACHEVEGPQEGWIGETLVWTKAQYDADQTAAVLPPEQWGQIAGPFQHAFVMLFHNGARSQLAEPRYVAAAAEWSDTARGRGIAYVYFEADYNRDLFPQGSEQLRIRLRGKRVYDPRSDTTGWSANPFLCARDYVLTPEKFGGIGWRKDDIDDANIIAQANIADEAVPLAGGGTEARWQYNGVLDTGASPKANLDILSTSWGGWWADDRGKLTFGGAAYALPSFTITESMMVGPLRTKARRPFEQQFNLVKAVYANPGNQFVPTDLPVLASDTYKAEDHDEELVRDLGELPGETSWTRGQRLTKLTLLKGRRQKTVDVDCNLAVWRVKMGDTVSLIVPRRGWAPKLFEVVGRRVAISPQAVRITLSLVETSAAIYDYLTSEELPHPAGPLPSLALPWAKPVVATPSMAEALYQTRGGGGVKCRITLSSSSDNPFIDAWQFSWRDQSDIVAVVRSLSDTPDDVISDFAPGIYVFGARARNKRGVWSVWTYSGPTEVYGLNVAPVPLQNLSIAIVSGMAVLRWDMSADLDVRQGGVIEVRHSADFAATWQTSTSIGNAVPGSSTTVTLPAISGRYLLRPVDARGNPGVPATINTTAPSLQVLVTEALVTEDPGFTGTRTNCTVAGGNLDLDTGQVAATYLFAGAMNFGSLKTVRLTANLAASMTDRSALIDARGPINLWPSVDVAADAEGDVQIFYRASPDNVPTWGGWAEFDRSDLAAWRLEFKAELSATDTRYLTEIDTLSVIAERV